MIKKYDCAKIMHGFILRLAEGVFYGFGGNVSAWDKEVYDSVDF